MYITHFIYRCLNLSGIQDFSSSDFLQHLSASPFRISYIAVPLHSSFPVTSHRLSILHYLQHLSASPILISWTLSALHSSFQVSIYKCSEPCRFNVDIVHMEQQDCHFFQDWHNVFEHYFVASKNHVIMMGAP